MNDRIYIYNICVFERTFYIFEQKMLQALLKLGGWLYSRGESQDLQIFLQKNDQKQFLLLLKTNHHYHQKRDLITEVFFGSKHTLLETLFSKNAIF